MDRYDRVLTLKVYKDPNGVNSNGRCLGECSRRNYTFAGTEAAHECHCGNNYDYNRHGETPDNCKADCSMNTDETCGGTLSSIQIYSVCPTGKYKGEGDAVIDDKPNCKNECHCKALPCLYLNGQCRDGCAAGWRGEACNERDCEIENGGCKHQCSEDKSDEWCSCNEGFNVSPNNWRDCIDTDECERGLYDVDCHTCVNFIGGHTCLCNGTFVLDPNRNNETCIDISASTGPSSSMASTIGLAAGLAISLILAVIIFAVIFICVRQRRKEKLLSSKDELSGIPGISDIQNEEGEDAYPSDKDSPNETIIDTPFRVRTEAEAASDIALPKSKPQSKPEIQSLEEIYVNTSNSHFIAMNQLKQFIKDIEADDQSLLDEYKSIPNPKLKMKCASKPGLKSKQRFANIIPYDHNRVKLEKAEGRPLSDYINASHVQGSNGRKFIASQGPKKNTLTDFWRMIWEQRVERIAMLTNLVEIGTNKCMQYWPEIVNGKPMMSDQFTVKLLKEDVWPDFTRRQMEVSQEGTGRARLVTQYHYTTWPDHGVPSHATVLWRLFTKLTQDADKSRPILIHCSAGVGRTGTLIAIDHLLEQANNENGIDVYACVTALRQSRMHMVQSFEQYKFIHLAVLEAHIVGSTSSSEAEFMSHNSLLNRQSSVSTKTLFSEQIEILSSIGQSLSDEETGIARLAENSMKNRTNILPANRHLLFLQVPFNGRNDYINAVQVPGYKGTDTFVATQWPLEDTVVDFWRLVKDNGVQHIVLLEQLSPKIMPESGQTENFGGINVYCKEIEQNDTFVSCTVQFPEDVLYMNTNTEETNSTGQTVNVVVLKKPLNNQVIIDARSKLGLSTNNSSRNCAVVCTNGAKLCGLFIAAFNILDMVDAENEVDVFYGVQQIKVVRPEFIQSQEQFLQLYDIVKAYLKQKNLT